jgi:hypothetical protein
MIRVKVKGSTSQGIRDYDVALAENGAHIVRTVTKRKSLQYGFAYAPGHEYSYRTIKPHSAIWRRAVRAAWLLMVDEAKLTPGDIS